MRKWIPRTATSRGHFGKVPGKVILRDWWLFVLRNPLLRADRLAMVRSYVQQQLLDGLDPSTVKTRLIYIRRLGIPLSAEERQRAYVKLAVDGILTRLDRMKNKVGTKFKPLCPLHELRAVYTSPGSTERDRHYQLAWYILVVTGQRAGNLVGASFRVLGDGLRVRFLEGRKTEKKALRCGIVFRFAWSERPPSFFDLKHGRDFVFPPIGTKRNVAAHINTWLRAQGWSFTSTVPRVRLDNLLRELLNQKLLTTLEYERFMNHTTETSDKHYYAV